MISELPGWKWSYHCPCDDLIQEEKMLAGILYWARNKKMDLKDRIKTQFFPGPFGVKYKNNRIWIPANEECCDAHVKSTMEVPATKKQREILQAATVTIPDPWAYWRHYKSMEHCGYLVRHRLIRVWEFFQNGIFFTKGIKKLSDLIETPAHQVIENLPLYLHSDYPFMKLFAKDTLAGDCPWLFEMAGMSMEDLRKPQEARCLSRSIS